MQSKMKVHCIFCGRKLEVMPEKGSCRSCQAWFELSVKDGCVKKVTVVRCGEECACFEEDKSGK